MCTLSGGEHALSDSPNFLVPIILQHSGFKVVTVQGLSSLFPLLNLFPLRPLLALFVLCDIIISKSQDFALFC